MHDFIHRESAHKAKMVAEVVPVTAEWRTKYEPKPELPLLNAYQLKISQGIILILSAILQEHGRDLANSRTDGKKG